MWYYERKRKALIKKLFGEGLTKIVNMIDLCISGFLIFVSLLLILIGLTDNGILSAILALIALLFCVPNVVLRYIPFYKKLSNVIVIIISVVRYCIIGFLLTLSIINMPDPEFVNQNFTNISEDQTIEVGRNKMRISTYDYLSEKWTNDVYSYDYEYESSGRYILTIDYNTDMTADDTKYRYYEEDQKLCKLNYAENCITYYHIIKDAQ